MDSVSITPHERFDDYATFCDIVDCNPGSKPETLLTIAKARAKQNYITSRLDCESAALPMHSGTVMDAVMPHKASIAPVSYNTAAHMYKDYLENGTLRKYLLNAFIVLFDGGHRALIFGGTYLPDANN